MFVRPETLLERCQAEPQRARAALRTIRAASLQALAELQATVRILRGKAGAHRPRPGVAQLDALIGLAGGAGVRVELAVVGAARPLPPAVDLAAYRIVLEALTNVLRHAGSATATVRLTYRQGDLTVQVDTTGVGREEGGRRGAAATACSACRSGWLPWAGGWRPGHAAAASSAWSPPCPWTVRREASLAG